MKYDIRTATRDEVMPLFEAHHGYKSLGKLLTYIHAVYEGDRIVAAFAWSPPPPGASKSVCPEAPHAVLALVRMVAVPKSERTLKHISKPLRQIAKQHIDRTRWPVLISYSDEGQGHNGFVYECAGWTATKRAKRSIAEDSTGARVSTYANGKRSHHAKTGTTTLQRWESWIIPAGTVVSHMSENGWTREAIPNKVWSSGSQAYRYVKRAVDASQKTS